MHSTAKGDALENAIYDYFKDEIENDRFYLNKNCCKIFRQKGYYSKDRESNIIFDVVIEVYRPGADDYSSLIIIECKNYNHSVPVSDVEEFSRKVEQVAPHNSKSIIAVSGNMQVGAYKFAKNNGIGCVRIFPDGEVKWELNRNGRFRFTNSLAEQTIEDAFIIEKYKSEHFFYFFSSNETTTNFMYEFFKFFLSNIDLSEDQINKRPEKFNTVKYLDKGQIEGLAAQILYDSDYQGGEVVLNNIYKTVKNRGLRVRTQLERPTQEKYVSCLGRIDFKKLLIEIFNKDSTDTKRDRFTVAHELSHYFLNHGEYLDNEFCEERDFDFVLNPDYMSDIRRLEFQANYLAACILMPEINFSGAVLRIAKEMNLRDKGHGLIFLDNQQINRVACNRVVSKLAHQFNVSRQAVSIRLEDKGFLNDSTSSSKHIKNSLIKIYNKP